MHSALSFYHVNRRCLLLLALGLLASAARAATAFLSTPVMTQETQHMVRFLENYHFNGHELSHDDFHQLLPDFMAELDPLHLIFLATDQDKLNTRYETRLPKDLRYLGNLDAAFETYNLYHERAIARVAWIQAELAKDFDFTTQEEFLWDRAKASWPATTQEADELWHKRLKFELLQDLLNDKPLATAKDNVRKRYDRMLRNLDEIDAEEVQEVYLTSLAAMYDPHTSYMSPSTVEEFNTQIRLSLTGIGAQLSEEDGVCVIRELIPGGPADLSKQLHPNDKIVAVSQGTDEFVDVMGMKLRKVVQLIRGKKDTVVRLTIIPGDATDPSARREIRLVRDVVKLNASRAHATLFDVPAPAGQGTVPVGVIDLPGFYGANEAEDDSGKPGISATRDVDELLTKLKAAGVRGIVLDLRRNGGGLLPEAVSLTGLFIEHGPVVQVKDSYGRVDVETDNDSRVSWAGPLVVLTSRYSASASEIVAGALQNYGRAVVVGDNSTHGKGTVQNMIPVLDESQFRRTAGAPPRIGATKITFRKFYLPNGASTQNRGVISDVVLPSIEEYLPIGESDLPPALAWDTIRPSVFDGVPLAARFLSALRDKSRTRQDTLDEFAYLRRNIEHFHEREEHKSISLNLEERRRQKTEDDAFRAASKTQRAALAKANFVEKEIPLDGVEPAKEPSLADSSDSSEDHPENKDDDKIRLDVHLREGLRVMTDAIELWQKPALWWTDKRPMTASVGNRFAPLP